MSPFEESHIIVAIEAKQSSEGAKISLSKEILNKQQLAQSQTRKLSKKLKAEMVLAVVSMFQTPQSLSGDLTNVILIDKKEYFQHIGPTFSRRLQIDEEEISTFSKKRKLPVDVDKISETKKQKLDDDEDDD